MFRRDRRTDEKESQQTNAKPVRRKVAIKKSRGQEEEPQNEFIFMRRESIEKIFSSYKLQYNIAPQPRLQHHARILDSLMIKTRELRKLL